MREKCYVIAVHMLGLGSTHRISCFSRWLLRSMYL